jgi:hypothetical protein
MRQEERAKAGGERITRPHRSIEVCQRFCDLRGSESLALIQTYAGSSKKVRIKQGAGVPLPLVSAGTPSLHSSDQIYRVTIGKGSCLATI